MGAAGAAVPQLEGAYLCCHLNKEGGLSAAEILPLQKGEEEAVNSPKGKKSGSSPVTPPAQGILPGRNLSLSR
jgi:hypothetical protein